MQATGDSLDLEQSATLSGRSAGLSSALVLTRVVAAIAFAAQIFVAWRFWHLTWDDSAITLGFARTFAATGRIEPTPGSGIVEGYSTTLWMLLMAAAAKLASSPSTLLAVAKLSTLALNLANLLLMRRWLMSWTSEGLANIVAATMGCGAMFYETINGMETPLMLTLILTMLLLRRRGGRISYVLFLLAGCAFLLTRWEAAWLLVPFVLVERPLRRALAPMLTWLAAFVLSNLVRWRYFGAILPNTITAKRGIPYSDPTLGFGQQILKHLGAGLSVLGYCELMLVLLLGFALGGYFSLGTAQIKSVADKLRTSWEFRFTVLFTLFSLALTIAIGPNWGPPGRSFYCGWPFLFCLLLLPVLTDPPPRPWIPVVLCLAALGQMASRVHEMNQPGGPVYMPEATIDKVARLNTALSEIQMASHHQSLLFAGPDMGGLMLYAEGIRVLDLGALCDTTLARQGYGVAIPYVLEQRRPDAIEVHWNWTLQTNFGASPLFFTEYRPVYVRGYRMFLTRELLADIDRSRLTERQFRADGHTQEETPGDKELAIFGPEDYRLNQKFGSYFLLN